MITLTSVYRDETSARVLYDLLKERTPQQSVSHKAMPTFEEHSQFLRSIPYFAWYIIRVDGTPIGAIYLTRRREVGIFIFTENQGKGYAGRALNELRARHPGPMLANINPANARSLAFFSKMGARLIQHTFELPEEAP